MRKLSVTHRLYKNMRGSGFGRATESQSADLCPLTLPTYPVPTINAITFADLAALTFTFLPRPKSTFTLCAMPSLS